MLETPCSSRIIFIIFLKGVKGWSFFHRAMVFVSLQFHDGSFKRGLYFSVGTPHGSVEPGEGIFQIG